QLAAAAAVGAKALIVHGGSVTGGVGEGRGHAQLREGGEGVERPGAPRGEEHTGGGPPEGPRPAPAPRPPGHNRGPSPAGGARRRADRLLPGHLPRVRER